jgi:hypothetical protein
VVFTVTVDNDPANYIGRVITNAFDAYRVITNTATPFTGTNTVSVTVSGVVTLSVGKLDTPFFPDPVDAGNTLSYLVVITNDSISSFSGTIVLTDDLSALGEYVDRSSAQVTALGPPGTTVATQTSGTPWMPCGWS